MTVKKTSSQIKKLKIAILQDYFAFCGGGERLVLTLAKALDADIYAGFVTDTTYDLSDYNVTTLLPGPVNTKGLKYLALQHAFARAKQLRNYDVVIYSGNCTVAAKNAPQALNILYCHTPPRHLYDQNQHYHQRYPLYLRPAFTLFTWLMRRRYEYTLRWIDHLVANSKNIQRRITKFLRRSSTIVYPPCDLDRFKGKKSDGYFLSFARVDYLKRVPMIAEAFTQMPRQKLIIASGGKNLDEVRAIAENHKNIEVLGWVSEEKLLDLIAHCRATIYVPVDEDFGMSVVESMSAGKPVITVDDGGPREIIRDRQSGYLCPKSIRPSDITKAVRWLTPARARAMRPKCIARARRFSEEKFIEGMVKVISDHIQ